MRVRNFWVEGVIDGRATIVKGGPVNKTGGMRIKVYQRSNGDITLPVEIVCKERKGILTVQVWAEGTLKYENVSER